MELVILEVWLPKVRVRFFLRWIAPSIDEYPLLLLAAVYVPTSHIYMIRILNVGIYDVQQYQVHVAPPHILLYTRYDIFQISFIRNGTLIACSASRKAFAPPRRTERASCVYAEWSRLIVHRTDCRQ